VEKIPPLPGANTLDRAFGPIDGTAVQRRATTEERPPTATPETAARGVATPASPLPVANTIERAFGPVAGTAVQRRATTEQQPPTATPETAARVVATPASPLPYANTIERAFGPVAGTSVQRRATTAGSPLTSVHEAAARGVATPTSPLPYANTLDRVFGRHNVASIQAHQGPEAAASAQAIGAQAYTTGNHVVLGASPDLHTVAHEAAHVVQQRGGVQLKGGVGEAGDTYERHADAVADAVVAGRSAAPLLDQVPSDGHQRAAIQLAPSPPAPHSATHPASAGDRGSQITIIPPVAGIDKPGFIDNPEGSFLRTGPRELGGDTVRPERLPPAARVFVSGTHPKAPEWWYVTAFLDHQMLRGYVQGFRVNTDLPEPLAELRQVHGGDTAEGYAREKFGDAVTDGHDLRYYENVLLFVNQQRGRAAITGTYQDPGLLGGGANNVRLVAGHRIWLVSADYAKALQSVVPSGSLTGGAVAKVKRFAGHLEDILRSVTESRHHLDEVAGEYAQAIHDNLAPIVGIVAGFLAAEAISMFAAATPTGVGQAVAMVIQLALSAFGAAGMVTAGIQALEHGSAWLNTAWTAKGNESKILAASKEFLMMLVGIAMAALSLLGARGNYRSLVKIGGSTPISGLPVLAVAGGGRGGQMGSVGVGTAATTRLSNPGGAFGTAMAMSTKGDGEEKTSSESSHDGKIGEYESSTQAALMGQDGGARLTAGKNFKEHYISKKPLLEKILGVKLGKLKEGGGETFLKAISDFIDTGAFKYIGQGTLKKGMEAMNIYRGRGLTIVTKTSGEWVTLLQSGEGMDLAIQMIP
jgi:hypothetical protein